jgi:non-heme Fe2+,alpha-ketoglutarate-dependent halogenase
MNIATAHPLVRWAVLANMIALTRMRPIHGILPARVREKLLTGWTPEMNKLALRSFGWKLFLDMPCELPDPPSFTPRCEVADAYRFTPDDIARFYRDGFIGPITLFTPEQMAQMREAITAVLYDEARRSEIYRIGEGATTAMQNELVSDAIIHTAINGRDRHLDCPEIWRLIANQAVTERLAQLLGPDLLVWRSQFFDKPAGSPAIAWHAASVYLSEAFNEPVLRPRVIDELFQITTWVAIDDVDLENGCMQFIPGSHRRFLPAVFHTGASEADKNGKFVGLAVRPDHPLAIDFPIPPDLHESGAIRPMPLRAGQCVMFSERCIHGSGPNYSNTRRRMGITFRTVRPDVDIYGDKREHQVTYFNSTFDLANWGAVVLRGNPQTRNRLRPAPTGARTCD